MLESIAISYCFAAIVICLVKLFNLDSKLEWWWGYKRAKFINKAEDYEMDYRIPDISEFKQGFKFEILRHKKGDYLGQLVLLDASVEGGVIRYPKRYWNKDIWEEIEVWWDRKPKTITESRGGILWTTREFPAYDWLPWVKPGYIEKLIEENRVRVAM